MARKSPPYKETIDTHIRPIWTPYRTDIGEKGKMASKTPIFTGKLRIVVKLASFVLRAN